MSNIVMNVDELASAIYAERFMSELPPAAKKKDNEAPKENNNSNNNNNSRGGVSYDRWNVRPKSSIDYGYHGSGSTSSGGGGFYITTAINYANGPAHMGHAYEAATSDAIARYSRVKGYSQGEENNGAFFLTGSDEHGQKIADTATAEGLTPIQLCDKYVAGFQCLNQRMFISNDDYLRTTSDRHKRTAQELWKRCAASNDIYLDTYSGWYNIREETFVTDSDAQLSDYKDPVSGKPLKQVTEQSYFFKMSSYHNTLIQYIQDHPNFIRPIQHRNFILKRLQDDTLRDLSISRTSFDWGIPVPEGFDSNHVMYVWFDALTNYLTGVDALHDQQQQSSSLTKFWPADVHIIGKDILWFHTVIWPCILMSAKLPLPKTVFAHGFVNDKEGKKMSKSMGNVINPHDMLDKFPVDTFRWYLCKEAPYGGELSFNEDSLRDMHNADLSDTLGNLIHRATNLCQTHCSGLVPDVPPPPSSSHTIDFSSYCKEYIKKMDEFELQAGASIAIKAFRDINGYLTEQAPWHMKGDDRLIDRQIIVRATLEYIYALAHLLLPFIPMGASAIFQKFHTPPKTLLCGDNDLGGLRNLKVGTKIDVGSVLYDKLRSEEEEEKASSSSSSSSSNKKISHAEAQRIKKEKKAKEIAASKAGQQQQKVASASTNSNQSDFSKMDIRVGMITKVWNHPNADKLFCEEIDLGEDKPRQIASGLRGYYELHEMEHRKVLVVMNLKVSKIVGFESFGMVLAAKSEDGSKVELIEPPSTATIGERVYIIDDNDIDESQQQPFSSSQIKKKKIWEKVVMKLKTNNTDGIAMYDGKIIQTKDGPCSAATLLNAQIS